MSQSALAASTSASDDEMELDYLGDFSAQVVGIQYYPGTVNRHEMMMLERDPNNPYDRWAIRVDNIRGEKVGHLPRTLVMYMSPLVDAGKVLLEAAALGHGTTNKYKMPVAISCYGDESYRAEIARALRSAGCTLSSPHGPSAAVSLSQARSPGGAGPSTSRAAAPPPPAPKARRLTAQQVLERVNTVFDSLVAEESGPRSELEAAPVVKTPLYPHQKEALAWMVDLENDSTRLPVFWEPRMPKGGGRVEYTHSLANFTSQTRPKPTKGGILADDMGLGKSLTTIALIATNCPGADPAALRPIAAADRDDNGAPDDEESDEEVPPKKKARADKKAKEKKRKARFKSEQRAGEAAAAAAALQRPAAPPAANGPRATLILCPLSVVTGWAMQFEEHVAPGALKVLVYHGPNRDMRSNFISGHDVVISTYGTLASEAGARNGLPGTSWLRVIADEAHILKNPATHTSKAVRSLKAERRWGLTGTPIPNSLRDLHGLVAFLKMETLEEASVFRRGIERPVVNGEEGAVKTLQVLVGSLALRRTKHSIRNGAPLVALPPKSVFIVPVDLEAAAKAKYQRWEAAGRSLISQHMAAGTLLANYTAVLEVLLRLRQICCDASLVPTEEPAFAVAAAAPRTAASRLTAELTAQLEGLLREGLGDECPVCLYDVSSPCITLCKHIFCKRCIDAVISKDKPLCPLCRGPISHTNLVELPPEPEPTEDDGESAVAGGAPPSGAKIAALMGTLMAAMASKPEEKHVIFSQFTGMLDLVGMALAFHRIPFCRLDGRTRAAKRDAHLRAFAADNPSGPRVFLISLKAGGVGLNLTAANHAHILDPWWNPAVEEQASDRVHRLGQRRPVSIHRYIVQDSIEERMLELQEEKRKLMRAAFERRAAQDVAAARIRDVRLLMQLQ